MIQGHEFRTIDCSCEAVVIRDESVFEYRNEDHFGVSGELWKRSLIIDYCSNNSKPISRTNSLTIYDSILWMRDQY